jgi:NADH dehydrogenase
MPGTRDSLAVPGAARRPHVVVLGGGFGGLAAARALARAPVHVTLVDRMNHHVFQPLLYQVATANLAPSDIAAPLRHVLRDQRNATVLLAEATAVDLATRRVRLADGRAPLAYDYLVVAAGSRHAYFGHDAWEATAPGLKTLEDAVEIRRRLLSAFEHAEAVAADGSVDVRDCGCLTFVIVGGGPTGVELAGMIPEIARGALRGEFRRIDPRRARVLLVEAGPRLLPALPAPLGERARRDLEALGVDVRLDTRVADVASDGVVLRGAVSAERVAAATVLWAAGNHASALGASICEQAGLAPDRAGRVPVAADLSVPGHPEVFVVGDLARVDWPARGTTVPAVAPAAMQAGRRAGDNVARRVAARETRPFVYVDKGELATIGRHRAVASFFGGRLRVAGWMAWWFWLALHLAYLIGFRNRLSVLLQWGYAYLFGDRGARLILGAAGVAGAPDARPHEPDALPAATAEHRSAA